MHPRSFLWLLAAVASVASTSCQESPVPNQFPDTVATDNPDSVTAESDPSGDLAAWIKSTPFRAPVHCPKKVEQETPQGPYFTFNDNQLPRSDCFIDGPYPWGGHSWFVQRITDIGDPGYDVIRVCTKAAVTTVEPPPPFPTPCGGNAGPGGCKICTKVPHQG